MTVVRTTTTAAKLISAFFLSSTAVLDGDGEEGAGCVSAPPPSVSPPPPPSLFGGSAIAIIRPWGDRDSARVRGEGGSEGTPLAVRAYSLTIFPSSLCGRPSSNRSSEEEEGRGGDGRAGDRRSRGGRPALARERGALSKLPGSLSPPLFLALARSLPRPSYFRRLWPFPAIVLCRLLSLSLSPSASAAAAAHNTIIHAAAAQLAVFPLSQSLARLACLASATTAARRRRSRREGGKTGSSLSAVAWSYQSPPLAQLWRWQSVRQCIMSARL